MPTHATKMAIYKMKTDGENLEVYPWAQTRVSYWPDPARKRASRWSIAAVAVAKNGAEQTSRHRSGFTNAGVWNNYRIIRHILISYLKTTISVHSWVLCEKCRGVNDYQNSQRTISRTIGNQAVDWRQGVASYQLTFRVRRTQAVHLQTENRLQSIVQTKKWS